MHLLHSGFTLIELLAVLAIVAVLSALLFGATSKLRKRAELVKCVNNLRSIGAAAAAYASDHNNEWPYPEDSRVVPSGSLNGTWISRAMKVDGEWDGLGKTFPYLRDKRCYLCPANHAKLPYLLAAGDYSSEEGVFYADYITRGFNQTTAAFGPLGRTYAALGRRAIGSCQFAFAATNPKNYPLSRHNGKYPVLFSDGSVPLLQFPEGAVNPDSPPNINSSTAMQIKIWDYFDGKTSTLSL